MKLFLREEEACETTLFRISNTVLYLHRSAAATIYDLIILYRGYHAGLLE
jgi:hypothetical protein